MTELEQLQNEVKRCFKSIANFEALAIYTLRTNPKSYPLIYALLGDGEEASTELFKQLVQEKRK